MRNSNTPLLKKNWSCGCLVCVWKFEILLNIFKKTNKIRAGLDISQEGFILSLLSSEKDGYCLKNVYVRNFDEEMLRDGMITKPELFAASLRNIIEENRLDIKTVNISVAGSDMFIKTVTFPDIPVEELQIIAPQEASKHISKTAAQINVDFQLLEHTRKENKVDVILCALTKTISRNLSDTLAKAGLEINATDVSSFAMIRTLANAEMINNPDLNYVSVLTGYENTDINIIKNGMPVFSNNIPTGKKHIIESFMKGFGTGRKETVEKLSGFGLILPGGEGSSDPEFTKASNIIRPHFGNIASEIQKTVEFYASQNGGNIEPAKIILGGSGICVQNIDKYISNKLKIPTELCDSLKNFSHNPELLKNIPVSIPVLSTSIGAALHPA